jgi:hypothetical protein
MEVSLVTKGMAPFVMHNGRLADPLDPIAMELAALADKRNRTPAEEKELSDVEWRGSLYWDAELGAHVPTANIIRSLRDAATAWKLGEAVYRGVLPQTDRVALEYDGPKTIDGLAKRPEHRWRTTIRIGRNRTARTRPIFRAWSATFPFEIDDTELALSDLERIVERAGRLQGIGDARKLGYGRFIGTIRETA